MKFILAKKMNMSQVFTEDGVKIPVTVLEAGPCKVVQVKTKGKDGYDAVQIGFGHKKRLDRPQRGHQGQESFQYLREFRVQDASVYKVGQEISSGDFTPGESVCVSGVMKGRGFTGAVKRHGFHGAPASHGHDHPRAVGAIGGRFPQHTIKGMRMAGRMGGHWATVKNLYIVDIEPKKNLLTVSGAVPGARRGLVRVQTTGQHLKELIKIQAYRSKQEEMTEKSTKSANQGGSTA